MLNLFSTRTLIVACALCAWGCAAVGEQPQLTSNQFDDGLGRQLRGEALQVSEDSWQVQLTYEDEGILEAITIPVGDDAIAMDEENGVLPFVTRIDRSFLASLHEKLTAAPVPQNDAERMLLLAELAVLKPVLQDSANDVVLKQRKANDGVTSCGECCFRTAQGNGINGGLGWQTCTTIDTNGSWNPLHWTYNTESVSCFGARHCVFRAGSAAAGLAESVDATSEDRDQQRGEQTADGVLAQ